MQKLQNTQLPKIQNEEKITDSQESKGRKNINPDKIQPLHKWLFSKNTILNTLYILSCIHTCNRINTWVIEKQVQEQIQQELLKTLKIQENKKEEI